MRRREFIKLVGGAAAAWPLSVNAQPSAKIPRIGLMVTGSLQSPEARVQLDAFRQGLRQLGYTEGRNIAIEYRGADGRIERFPNLAAELVRLEVASSRRIRVPPLPPGKQPPLFRLFQ